MDREDNNKQADERLSNLLFFSNISSKAISAANPLTIIAALHDKNEGNLSHFQKLEKTGLPVIALLSQTEWNDGNTAASGIQWISWHGLITYDTSRLDVVQQVKPSAHL